jgi:MoaA/NifB/PqqE/SkfB family radical SAM enzyme
MSFPRFVSFTITNACDLHCRMCGQWSAEGYMHGRPARPGMALGDWMRVADEVAAHGVQGVLVRGGEPLSWPGIIELLDHMAGKGLFISIDTNGTRVAELAPALARIGRRLHLTVSVDGPEEIHDAVRGSPGCFRKIAAGLTALADEERRQGVKISRSLTFTISPWSVRGLGAMPGVARALGVQSMCIVPYYYVPEALGRAYERELQEELGCAAFSWRGFHHETSGVDFGLLREQLRLYRAGLAGLTDFPYMPFSEEEYRTWFEDPAAPVRSAECRSVEHVADIQPTGEVDFCVDFPDYSLGNVREATLDQLWNNERACRFRNRRRAKPFSACHRCGAKYMALMPA